VAFLVCAEVGRFLSMQAGAPGLLWLPAGLWLWSMLTEKPSAWGWFAVPSAVAVALFVGHHSLEPRVAVGVYAGTGVAAATAAGAMRGLGAHREILSTLRGFLIFCLAAPIAGAALGGAVQVGITGNGGVGPWFAVWCRLAAGMLLVTPFLSAWMTHTPATAWRRPSPLWLEGGLLLCGLGVVSWFTFHEGTGSAPVQQGRIFIFALWAGLRLGLPGASLMLLAQPWVLALTAGGRMGPGFEPFLAISAPLALVPAILLEEQHRRVVEFRALASLCSRAERREHHRARILEMISSNAPPADILDYVARSAEEESPQALCSILLLDSGRQKLLHGAAPSLPAFYNEAINGVRIGEGVGSCGTAAFLGRRVVVEDLATHPYWRDFHELAGRAGLRSCWSEPVKSSDGAVLGTFAIYHREPRLPSPPEIEAIEIAAGYVSLAVERTRAREALRESQARLLIAMDMARLGHWEYDVARQMFLLDATFHRLLGAAPGEESRNRVSLEEYGRRFLSPTDAATFEAELVAAQDSRDEDVPRCFSQDVRRADGTQGHLAVRLARMQSGQDGAVRIVGVCQDVTEQRDAERTRSRLEEQLRQARSLEALGTLAGGTAHEFNNILGIILGHVELAGTLLDAHHPASDELAGAGKAVRHGREIVEQLLTFSRHRTRSEDRIDRRAARMRPLPPLEQAYLQQSQTRELIDLRTIVAETAGNLRRQLPPMITLALDLPPELTPVRASITQVHSAIFNLGKNAIQALGDRSGSIRIGVSAVTLAPGPTTPQSGLSPGCYVRLTVSDDGPGMNPATLARVFEPFFTTKPTGEGNGLGLAMVHGIMQSHGGAVRIDSTPGQGTCCELWFPAMPGETVAAPEAQAPRTVPTGHGEHILVVDDEPSLVSVLTKYLRRQGYRVTAAGSAEEALRVAGESASGIDLAVTDLTMPGMNGAQLARALAQRRPGIPVILATGGGGSGGGGSTPDREAIPHVSAILLKPFSTETLARAIHQALQLAPARQPSTDRPQP
jgi:signal transduction histidine kinase/ActR/RegA family two-component response regulator